MPGCRLGLLGEELHSTPHRGKELQENLYAQETVASGIIIDRYLPEGRSFKDDGDTGGEQGKAFGWKPLGASSRPAGLLFPEQLA